MLLSHLKTAGHWSKVSPTIDILSSHVPQGELDKFADAFKKFKKKELFYVLYVLPLMRLILVLFVRIHTDSSTICVVEQTLDVLALEKSGKYKDCIMYCMDGLIRSIISAG